LASAHKRDNYWRGKYKNDKGVWDWVSRNEAGERFRTKTAAKAYATSLEEKAKNGHFVNPKKGRTTFAEWTETWLDALDVDEGSERSYRSRLNSVITPEWGNVELAQITNVAYRAWEKRLNQTYKPNTVSGLVSLFRTILDDAVVSKLLAENPVPTRKAARRGRFRGNQKQEDKVIATPRQALLVAQNALQLRGLSFYVQVLTHAYAGMRIGEVAGLRRGDLILDDAPQGNRILLRTQSQYRGGRPTLLAPKYMSTRDLILPPFLTVLFRQLLASHGQDLVFTAPKGGRVLTGGEFYSESWDPIVNGTPPRPSSRGHAARAGLRPVIGVENMVPHGLRHSMKVWLDELGMPRIVVEERMGHVIQGSEGAYSHTTLKMELALADALQRLWEEAHEEVGGDWEYGPIPEPDVPAV
jgi:integrase